MNSSSCEVSLSAGSELGSALCAIRQRLAAVPLGRATRHHLDHIGQLASPPPGLVSGCARLLEDAGFIEDAEIIYATLRRCAPTNPAGFAGRIRLALRRREWADALVGAEDLIARFPGHESTHFWQASRAHALVRLGRGDEAESVFRDLLACRGAYVDAWLGLLNVLLLTGRAEQALFELDSSAFRHLETAPVILKKLDILVRLRRLDDARACFAGLLPGTDDPALLEILFNFVPRLFDGWRRTSTWIALLGRLDTLAGRSDHGNTQLIIALRLRLLLALRDYEQFLQILQCLPKQYPLGPYGHRLRVLAATLREPSFRDYGKPKIFGIGLSKTGTTSLANALRSLGLQVLDYENPLTRELIGDDDLHLFDAFTDTPPAACFERLYFLFKRSKFIYTTRPVESWTISTRRHWRRSHGLEDFHEIRALIAAGDAFAFGRVFSDLQFSLFFNHAGFDEAYEAHDRRVRGFFQDKPQDRFLEFNVFAGQGWQELCSFLDVPIPSVPYPRENTAPSP